MTNVSPSKKIHSVEEARIVAKKRVPKLMFDFVDVAHNLFIYSLRLILLFLSMK